MRPLTEIETQILTHLNTDIPEPRYPLWTDTASGQVVGFYYASVAVEIFETQEYGSKSKLKPGWKYAVESDGEIEFVSENQIALPDSEKEGE